MTLWIRWKMISLNNQLLTIGTFLMAMGTFVMAVATICLVVTATFQYYVLKDQAAINRNELKTMTDQSEAIRTQLETTRKTTTQQFFITFYEQWESEGMQKRRARLAEALMKKPIPEDVDDSPLVFLETLANASKRGLIDPELLWTTFSVDVEGYWPAAEPYVKRIRQSEKCECLFAELEGLHNDLVKQDRDRGDVSSLAAEDPDAVRRFLKWEKAREN